MSFYILVRIKYFWELGLILSILVDFIVFCINFKYYRIWENLSFYSGFLCYRKDSESYIRRFQQERLPSWPVNGGWVLAGLGYRIGICMFYTPFLLSAVVRMSGGSKTVCINYWYEWTMKTYLILFLAIVFETVATSFWNRANSLPNSFHPYWPFWGTRRLSIAWVSYWRASR